MSIVFCLVFLLCFSQVGSASFSAQMDLVKPSVSFTVRGDKEAGFGASALMLMRRVRSGRLPSGLKRLGTLVPIL